MPEFTWHYCRETHRYVITRGGRVYQTIVPSRRNPAHSRTYVERSVKILNGDIHE